jgi:hypothetical protein
LNFLAVLHQTKGQPEKAEPLMKESLAIYSRAFGQNHPAVAQTQNNLGTFMVKIRLFTSSSNSSNPTDRHTDPA